MKTKSKRYVYKFWVVSDGEIFYLLCPFCSRPCFSKQRIICPLQVRHWLLKSTSPNPTFKKNNILFNFTICLIFFSNFNEKHQSHVYFGHDPKFRPNNQKSLSIVLQRFMAWTIKKKSQNISISHFCFEAFLSDKEFKSMLWKESYLMVCQNTSVSYHIDSLSHSS